MVLHFYCTNVIQVLLGNAGGVALQFLSRGTISQSPIQQELDGFAFYVCQYNNQPGYHILFYFLSRNRILSPLFLLRGDGIRQRLDVIAFHFFVEGEDSPSPLSLDMAVEKGGWRCI